MAVKSVKISVNENRNLKETSYRNNLFEQSFEVFKEQNFFPITDFNGFVKIGESNYYNEAYVSYVRNNLYITGSYILGEGNILYDESVLPNYYEVENIFNSYGNNNVIKINDDFVRENFQFTEGDSYSFSWYYVSLDRIGESSVVFTANGETKAVSLGRTQVYSSANNLEVTLTELFYVEDGSANNVAVLTLREKGSTLYAWNHYNDLVIFETSDEINWEEFREFISAYLEIYPSTYEYNGIIDELIEIPAPPPSLVYDEPRFIANNNYWGNVNAPLTVKMYLGFGETYSKQFHEEIFLELFNEYGGLGQVKFEHHDHPLYLSGHNAGLCILAYDN